MDKERALWQRRSEVLLYLLREVVSLLHRPPAGHENMHRDKAALAGCPRAQSMESDISLLVARQDLGDAFPILGRQGSVEQSLRGVAQQPDPDPHYVRGDKESDQGVEHDPPGESCTRATPSTTPAEVQHGVDR